MTDNTPRADLDLDQVRRDHKTLTEFDPYLWYDVALQTYDGLDAGRVEMAILRDLAILGNPDATTHKLFGKCAHERLAEYAGNMRRTLDPIETDAREGAKTDGEEVR